MPSLTLRAPYKRNQGVMSPSEMIETYFFGISLCDADGNKISSDVLQLYLESATEEIENYLDIKIQKQIIEEDLGFWLYDWKNWGYIRTSYPVVKPQLIEGFINDVRQITYPQSWLSARRTNDGKTYFRTVNLVPTNGTTGANSQIYSGITPHLGFYGNKNIPNYWQITYCTGFDKVPSDLLNAIGKLAAINVFHIMGDLILGAGIASQSIGIDGLSQSIATTSSATNAGYGARVSGYLADLKLSMPKLRAFYKGMNLTSA